jgi:pre-mRNA-splicing factor ATP-dependent RNA helicase DHX16
VTFLIRLLVNVTQILKLSRDRETKLRTRLLWRRNKISEVRPIKVYSLARSSILVANSVLYWQSRMDLRSWVSDNTIRFLGAAHSQVVEYIIAVAQSAKSPDDLYVKLSGAGFPSEAKGFAENLFIKVPQLRRETTTTEKKAKQQESVAFLKQNSSYKLLLEPEEETSSELVLKEKKEKREKKSKTRRRENADDQWASDEEEKRARKRRREEYEETQRAKYEMELDEEEQEELKRQDEQERDEFAEKMKAKNKAEQERVRLASCRSANCDQMVEDRSSETRNRRKLGDDAAARAEAVPDLRKESRQQYLTKRQSQQIEILKQQVHDDQVLWNNERLTKREIRDIEKRREALQIALERQNIDDGFDAYAMPDEYFTRQGKIDKKRREEVLTKRYHEPKSERYVTDGDQWEQYQTKLATSQLATSKTVQADEYDYVFDDAQNVSFIMDSTMAGATSAERRKYELKLKEVEERAASIEAVRKALPVYAYRDELVQAIKDHQILIVVGETGSGKTTQIPQFLYEEDFAKDGKVIGCTQPRRVAAMSVAARVAEEMGKKLGSEVGYSIRFEDATTPGKTMIKYMTDGMLLRQILSEPGLDSYSVMMIDEAHERNLATDLLLGLLKDISRWRTDLKIIISSATLDAQKFSDFFDNAPIFMVPGRRYDVDVFYTESPESNYVTAVLSTVFQIHISQPPGDILVFLTGQEEIEACAENLTETCRKLGSHITEMIIAPIYANLPADQQAKIFEPTPPNARKVILSTNIAESSITVDQVAFVIDTGFVKENHFNPRTGIESLLVSPISKASAQQRAGRAGRTGKGSCFRLYTKWAYMSELQDSTTPEIQRTNLSNTVLTLKSLGINQLLNFPFLDAPHPETLMRALELLYALGALRDDGELTKLGRQMAEIPLDPKASKSIIAAGKLGCVEEVVSILSMLQEGPSLFYRPKQQAMEADARHAHFSRGGVGDHIALLNIWNEFVEAEFSYTWARENYLQIKSLNRVRDVRDQLVRLCERIEVDLSSSSDHVAIKKAITAGYFFNVGRLDRSGESYHVAKNGGQQLYIHPSSSMFNVKPPPRFILYNELVLTSKEYARNVMEIQPGWLTEAAPHYYDRSLFEKKAMPKGKGLSKF